jgi:hypothetical protein
MAASTTDPTPRSARPVPSGALRDRVLTRANLPLLGIVAAGFLYLLYWALQVAEWGVMQDELLYVKLALHLGDTLSPVPEVRGEYYGHFALLYPLIIAPVFAVLSMPAAFTTAHVVNAALISSTAIPTYLLARELGTSRVAGWCSAALAIFVPWIIFVNHLTSEALAYPLFVWTVLAMLRATSQPSPRRDLVALTAIGFATLARLQFIFLAPVFVVAVLVHEIWYEHLTARQRPSVRSIGAGLSRAVARHRVLAAATALGLLVLAAFAVTGGSGRTLGNYEVAATGELLPHGISRSIRGHLALLISNVFVIPFVLAVAWGIVALIRPTDKTNHAFALILALAVAGIVVESASVNLRTIGVVVQERYAFYVVPLVLVAMTAYIERPRWILPAVTGGALLVLLMLTELDYAYANSYSYASPFVAVVEGRTHDLGALFGVDDLSPKTAFALGTVACGVALVLLLRRVSGTAVIVPLSAVLLAAFVIETTYNFNKILPTQDDSQAELGLDTALARDRGLDWVDDLLPGGAEAAMVPAVVGPLDTTRKVWWDAEFWNKKVAVMYSYDPAWRDTPYPDQAAGLDWESGAIEVREPRRYLLVPRFDRRFRPAGRLLGRTAYLDLIDAPLPLRAQWAIRGTDGDGWTTAGKPATVRLFAGSSTTARRVRTAVQLTSTPHVTGPRSFRITSGKASARGVVASNTTTVARLSTCGAASPTNLTIRVRGSSTLPGGRRVGLAVTGVKVSPAGRCRP